MNPPRLRDPAEAGGLLLYVLATRWTVVPFQRLSRGGGWLCALVGGDEDERQVALVRDDLIASAVQIVHKDQDPVTDRDTFLWCWTAHLWPRWPGSTAHQFLGSHLQGLLAADSYTVSLADGNVWRATAIACRVPTDRLGLMLNNLVEAELLAAVAPRTFRLTLPPPARVTAVVAAAGATG